MPDYVTMSDLVGNVPPQFCVQALDDDQDGVADAAAWTAVLNTVSTAINGKLGQRFAVPFSNPIPAVVLDVALTLASSKLYERRGVGDDKNPFAKQRDEALKKLDAIANGKEPLTPEINRQKPSAKVIKEKSRLSASDPSDQKLSV